MPSQKDAARQTATVDATTHGSFRDDAGGRQVADGLNDHNKKKKTQDKE